MKIKVGQRLMMMVMFLIIIGVQSMAQEGKKFKIGISQFAEHPALDDVRKGFEDELKSLGVNADIIYKNSQGDTGVAGVIAQKFVSDKADLIFGIATVSAQAAKQSTDKIPVLFSAVTDPVNSQLVKTMDKVGGNVTGTTDATPMEKQLGLFQKIDPKIKKVGIIYNTSESNSEIQVANAKEIGAKLGLEIRAVGVNNINDIPQAVNSMISKVDGFYTITDNIVASAINLISMAANERGMVTVGAEEAHVKGGILLTDGLSYYELGRQTGRMAKEILVDGKKPEDMPVETLANTTKVVNVKTMNNLKLNKELPVFEGAEFIEQ
ncbi:ABC transporter substrate-binding protein [Fusobacterium varium]|jgi:putative ABC transport system substrate-binding protein|uniref:ABC transporter substrate-binding protein n=1 Tax=Fusobacterium varium TaxID=856 RepID=UPI000E4120F3|nr:ABC transporter substrate-binding protein [Fusobacterium varium]MCI6033438.1 ABC transporter substrate-binding protein [Fusobacterium varium]MDY4005035.1 ABC transporter substrate-binding protein [Fusobacterium varium]RGJ32126.1 BMP family ABC transporter substrate-binding protein [Fusobacterium varium]